ncbi:MAG: hypothetical protein Q8868_14145 [Bacteroidota bacterium]|nr:hypothetical protein [Bacteroidota bacterium]
MNEKLADLKLRPHHIIDIITGYGNNVQYQPHPFGHARHLVAPKLLSDLNLKVKLVLGADDICTGCRNLLPNGKCSDVLAQLTPSPSKQAYNDVLDSRLFDHFTLAPDCTLSTGEYLEIVNKHTPGLERICTHPKEDPEERLTGLINGLKKLGIRRCI